MITDALLNMVSSQVVTASAVSEDTVDLGVARDIGEGKDLYLAITVEAAPTTPTTMEFQAISSAAAALSSPTVLGSSGAIAIASLPVGTIVYVRINARNASLGQRYLGANFVPAGGTTTTSGTYSVNVVETIQDGRKSYPSGFSVS